MKYYAAPMEGITGYVYRNAHHHYYPGMDKYYTPFLTPKERRGMTSKEKNDILPAHNKGIPLVPQVLTNRAHDFLNIMEDLGEMGYNEVNLNLGCPSGTVVSKGKGCGFLANQDKLKTFFEDVMNGMEERKITGMSLSVKTRLGVDDPEEILDLMEIYNTYPISELTIHARIHKDFYKKPVNREMFGKVFAMSRHPVCYNGDIFYGTDLTRLQKEYPQLEAVMLGRGLISNPQLREDCEKTQNPFDYERFFRFHDEVLAGYVDIMSGERNVLFKMKELWYYMAIHFPGQEKMMKKIKKSSSLVEYKSVISALSY